MQRLFLGIALALAAIPLAAAPSATPSHPLSHIHPVDVDFNMSGQEIFNVSNIKIQDGMNITKDSIQPGTYAGLGTDALKWNNSHQRWEVKNSNLSLENNEIQEFFDNQCDGGEVVAQVYDNGSYKCQSITETSEDKFVNEAGDTMNGSLNFSDYADYSINNLSNVNNFFADDCDGDAVITEVNSDGTYNCTSTSTLNGIEDLSETLSEGNTADGNNINMTGENITNIGSLKDFFASTCSGDNVVDGINPNGTYDCVDADAQIDDIWVNETGDNITGDLDLNDNDLIEIDELRTNGTGSDVIAVRDTNAPNDIIRFKEGGDVEIPNGDLDLSDNNISNYWSNNLCSEDRAIQKVYRNGTVTCTEQIEFTDNTENLSETLQAGNIANQSINMSGSDLDGVNNLDLREGFDNGQIRTSGGTNIIQFYQSSQKVAIPNGNLDMGDNLINDTSSYRGPGGTASQPLYRFQYDDGTGIYSPSNNNVAISTDSTKALDIDSNQNVNISSGNLDLSKNITGYWTNNLCEEDRAVQKVYENGTVTCTEQIEFTDNTENLSMTLLAGNVANQSIDMDGNNVTSIENLVTDGRTLDIWDSTNNQQIIEFKEGGDINISNGNLDFAGGNIRIREASADNSNNLEFRQSSYSNIIVDAQNGRLRVYNKSDDTDILRADTGGSVEIANGDLEVNDNAVKNVNSIDGGGDSITVDSNLDTDGNSVTSSGGEICLGDQCQ